MAEDKKATFGIKIPVETNAKDAANSVDILRQRLQSSQDVVKTYNDALKSLRGSTEAVKSAKVSLKAAIDAETASILHTTSEIVKQQKAVTTSKVKQTEFKQAITSTKSELSKLLPALKEVIGVLAAYEIALQAVNFAKWLVDSVNSIRTLGLFREAALGSEENAKNFGDQITETGRNVRLTNVELNELSVSLGRSLIGARISGQGIVDVFNAVAQETGALGKEAGKQIEDLLTRGKQFGRFTLGLNELQGTGLQFNDIAEQLSKQLGIGLKQAQIMLVSRGADLSKAASAVRAAVEKKFAGVNLKHMLDFNVILQKAKENFGKLTADVDLEKFLRGFARIGALFDGTTVQGGVLKDIITSIGNTLGGIFDALTQPEVLSAITDSFLQLQIYILQAKLAFRDLTGGIDIFGAELDTKTIAIYAVKAAFVAIGVVILGVTVIIGTIVAAMYGLFEVSKVLGATLFDLGNDAYNWGQNMINGLVKGITDGISAVKNVVGNVGDTIKSAFTSVLGIHSPSAVFEMYGRNTVEGYNQGVNSASPGTQGAIENIAPSAPSVGKVGQSGIGSANVHVNISFPNAKDGKEVAATLTGDSFRAQFTKALEEMLVSAGVPTQTAQAGVT